MAHSTIPDLSAGTLQTGHYFPVALTSNSDAQRVTIEDVSSLFNSSYFVNSKDQPVYTDAQGLTYNRFRYIKNNFSIQSGHLKVGGITRTSGLIAGDFPNNIVLQPNTFSTIAGGSSNTNNTRYGFIGNGLSNKILPSNTDYSVIVGGFNNIISNDVGVIVGGDSNKIGSSDSVIVGGSNNVITGLSNDDYNFLGAGFGNQITSGDNNFLGAGVTNLLAGHYTVINGGLSNNAIFNSVYSVIGGGSTNLVSGLANVIGGGSLNRVLSTDGNGHSTIGGGSNNYITGDFSVIPGGSSNTVNANHGYAAGRRSRSNHQGAFVLSDSRNIDGKFSSNTDTITFHFQNGAVFSGTPVNITGGVNLYLNGELITVKPNSTVTFKNAGMIFSDYVSSGCQASNVDTLLRNMPQGIKANTLSNNGDKLKIRVNGNTQASAQMSCVVGSEAIVDDVALGGALAWSLNLEFIRSGVSTTRYNYVVDNDDNPGSTHYKNSFTNNLTWTNDNQIRISGDGVTAGDITVESMSIEYWPI